MSQVQATTRSNSKGRDCQHGAQSDKTGANETRYRFSTTKTTASLIEVTYLEGGMVS